jgi:hypothetical protein
MRNEGEKLCMEIQWNSLNTATGCLGTAASFEIGSVHATFDEVRAMNCVRGESRLFAIPNQQQTVLVICTKFYSAKSIHAPSRQNILSAALRDCQTTPPVSQNNKQGQHYKPGT